MEFELLTRNSSTKPVWWQGPRLAHQKCCRRGACLIPFIGYLRQSSLQNANVRPKARQWIVPVRFLILAQRAQEPTQRPAVRAFRKTTKNTDAARHSPQFPAEMAQAAQDAFIQMNRLVCASGLERVMDCFLHQIERGWIFGQLLAGPAPQADKLFADY